MLNIDIQQDYWFPLKVSLGVILEILDEKYLEEKHQDIFVLYGKEMEIKLLSSFSCLSNIIQFLIVSYKI